MKKIKNLIAVLLVMMISVFSFCITAGATDVSNTQDGLTASITSLKDNYKEDEDIEMTFKVANTNSFTVENVSLEALIPNGLKMKNRTDTKTDTVSLSADGSLEFDLVLAVGNTVSNIEPTQQIITSETTPTSQVNQNAVTNTANTTNGQSGYNAVATGNNTSYPLIAIICLICLAIVIVAFKYRKKTAKYLSLVLCLCVSASSVAVIGISNVSAEETTQEKSFEIVKSIQVNNKEYKIGLKVLYSALNTNNENTDNDTICIKGKIKSSDLPLSGAEISVYNGNNLISIENAVTNDLGEFEVFIPALKNGANYTDELTLKITKDGYISIEKSFNADTEEITDLGIIEIEKEYPDGFAELKYINYFNNKLCYNPYTTMSYEYFDNSMLSELPDKFKGKVGQFFVMGDYIYYTPVNNGTTHAKTEIRKMKTDGSNDKLVSNDFSTYGNCQYSNGKLLYNSYSQNDNLIILDLSTGQTRGFDENISSAVLHNGNMLYYQNNNDIKCMDIKTNAVTNIALGLGSPMYIENNYLYCWNDKNELPLSRISLSTNVSENIPLVLTRSDFIDVSNGLVYYTAHQDEFGLDIYSYNIDTASTNDVAHIKSNFPIYHLKISENYITYTEYATQEIYEQLGYNRLDYVLDINNGIPELVSYYFNTNV